MSALELELYDLIKSKLGERESRMLLEVIETKVSKEFVNAKDSLATKEDIANLKESIANVKAEIIKWMFLFWVGTIALSGLLKVIGVI